MSFQQMNPKTTPTAIDNTTKLDTKSAPGEISFDALYANLPLTEEQMKLSNDSLSEALYQLGKSFANELEDCALAIRVNEEIVARFPAFKKMDEAPKGCYQSFKLSRQKSHL